MKLKILPIIEEMDSMGRTIISRPQKPPALNITWWGMAAGLLAFLSLLAAFFVNIALPEAPSGAAPVLSIVLGNLMLLFGIAALVLTGIALAKGERSWAVWVGFVPAALICAFWAFMFVGDLLLAG